MNFEDKVIEYIKANALICPGDEVALGLSGGADSVALFFVLKSFYEKTNGSFTFKAVHVNHGIRGEEAERDERFCRELCERENIKLEVIHLDVPAIVRQTGESEEEAGRRLRYESLRNSFGKGEAENLRKICVAHHRDDQAETVIFNMTRGSGIGGMKGMTAKNGDVIRPLLAVSKSEIEAYLSERGESYVIDRTNFDAAYSRNRIRKNIIPELEKINDGAVEHICNMAHDVYLLEDFLNRETDRIYSSVVKRADDGAGGLLIADTVFKDRHEMLVKSVLKRALIEISGAAKDIGRVHFEKLKDLFFAGTGATIDLPYRVKALKCASKVRLYVEGECEKPSETKDFEWEIIDRSEIKGDIPKKDYTKYLDYDKITEGVTVRYMREGDYITVDASGHRKKLSRYMIDEKVDRKQRACIPLVCDGSHVLWVVGHRISESAKVSDTTQRIIRITYTG